MLLWLYLRDSVRSEPALSCSGRSSPWRSTDWQQEVSKPSATKAQAWNLCNECFPLCLLPRRTRTRHQYQNPPDSNENQQRKIRTASKSFCWLQTAVKLQRRSPTSPAMQRPAATHRDRSRSARISLPDGRALRPARCLRFPCQDPAGWAPASLPSLFLAGRAKAGSPGRTQPAVLLCLGAAAGPGGITPPFGWGRQAGSRAFIQGCLQDLLNLEWKNPRHSCVLPHLTCFLHATVSDTHMP